MAAHSSVLAWRLSGKGATVYGVAQSQTGLAAAAGKGVSYFFGS